MLTKAEDKIYRYLDTNGDGTGTKNANVNGSITPVTFKIVPEIRSMKIYRMMIQIEDAGTLAADKYGVLALLTNGMLLQVRKVSDDSVVLDFLDGIPVKDNQGWARHCFDHDPHDYGPPTDASISYRLSFNRAGFPLHLDADHYLCIVVQDDLTGLLGHYFQVQGEYI